jgi:hypothetical protein
MTDTNVLNACTNAGLQVPCTNEQNGSYADSLCLDIGWRDGGNPMGTLSKHICNGNWPSSCTTLSSPGTFQYMGQKWSSNACGVVGTTWCAGGNSYANLDALCVYSGSAPIATATPTPTATATRTPTRTATPTPTFNGVVPVNAFATWRNPSTNVTYSFYKVRVAGAMSDANVYSACAAVGLSVPCNDAQNGAYTDNLCLDIGWRDGGNPMGTLSRSICNNNLPNTCTAINDPGTFQYMGNKWPYGACGATVSQWCTFGNSSQNLDALCVYTGTQAQTPAPNPSTPPNAFATWTNPTTNRRYSLYKVPVVGTMTDTNVFNACSGAGLSTPCANPRGGLFTDNLCLDVGWNDQNNPMSTLARSLCDVAQPTECNILRDPGTFQYMGENWASRSSCGVVGTAWCAIGSDYSNHNALCIYPEN